MEIINHFIWISDVELKKFLDNLIILKSEYGLEYRFQVFLDTLKNTNNVIMIEAILSFVINLVTCSS